jgi:hypothetical protein
MPTRIENLKRLVDSEGLDLAIPAVPTRYLVVEYAADEVAWEAELVDSLDKAAQWLEASRTERKYVRLFDLDTSEVWRPVFKLDRWEREGTTH